MPPEGIERGGDTTFDGVLHGDNRGIALTGCQMIHHSAQSHAGHRFGISQPLQLDERRSGFLSIGARRTKKCDA